MPVPVRKFLCPALVCVFLAIPTQAVQPPVSWSRDFGEPVSGARPLWNDRAASGIAVTLGSGSIVILDAAGQRIAEAHLDARALVPALPAENFGNRRHVLLATDEWGAVYAFDESGKRLWKSSRETKVGDFRMPVIADLRPGSPAYFMEDWLGHVFATGADGKLAFEFSSARSSPPAVAPLGPGGEARIYIGTEDGTMVCLTPRGEVVWVKNYPGKFGRAVPVVADADRNGRYEVYFSTPSGPSGLYAVDAATGEKLWFAASSMQSYQAIALADLDGDGRDEILYADKNTRLYCVDSQGHARWDTQVDGKGIFFSPVIVDTPPHRKRIFQVARATGVNGKTLYEIDADGRLMGEYAVPGGGANSPVLFQYAGRNELSMLVVPNGNQVICYGLPAGYRSVWPGNRNDLANSGFVASAQKAMPVASPAEWKGMRELRAALLGSNTILVDAPAGRFGALRTIDREGTVRLKLLPAEAAAHRRIATLDLTEVGEYAVDLVWPGGTDNQAHFRFTLDRELSADRSLLAECQQQLRSARERLPERRELIDFLDTTAQAQFEQASRVRSAARFAEARTFFEYAMSLAGALERTKAKGSLLLRPIANPWVNFDAANHLRQLGSGDFRLEWSMLGNEYESVAVSISNLEPRPAVVRLTVANFDKVDARRIVEIREVPQVLTESGVVTEDVLPLLGESQTVRLGAGETRKLWLIFHSRDLAAGTHRSALVAADLLAPGSPPELPIELKVHSVRLPEGFTFRHCSWFYAASIADPELRRAAMRDVVSHGMNVFMIPAATVTVDRAGNLTATDGAFADQLISEFRALSPKGRHIFLVNGSVGIRWPEGFTAPPDIAERALGNGLHWYAGHMRSLGLSPSDYALYTMDEPGLMGKDAAFDRWVEQVKQIKRLEPGIWMYADPAGGADAAMLEPVASLIEVWAPDISLLRDPKRGPGLDQLFRRAKAYWRYEPPGDSRTLDPQSYYREHAWSAWHLGITGGGYWVYSDSPFWARYLRSSEYGTVYPGANGPVTTRRWEATRDGSEEFELLTILRQRIDAHPESAGAKEARALMEEAVQFATAGPSFGHETRRLGMPVPDFARWQDYKLRLADMAEKLEK